VRVCPRVAFSTIHARVLCLYPPIADAYSCHVFRARISYPTADDTKNGAVWNGASVVPPYTSSPAKAGGDVPDDAVAKSDSESTAGKKFVTGRPDEQFSSEAAQERQTLFNDIAPVYDKLNDVLSLGLHRVWKRAAVRWTGVGPGDKAIDVCCGSGDIALRLADAVGPSGEVVGLDFASAQLKVAAQKETEHPAGYVLSPISWQQGDALSLPYPDCEFHGATIGYGLRNVSDIPKALSELQRVLKKGGKAAVVDFNNSTNQIVNQVQGLILDNLVVPAADILGVAAEYRYLKVCLSKSPRSASLITAPL
jgi:ubiquinone/menaquinone biosynthesis methyltransferase